MSQSPVAEIFAEDANTFAVLDGASNPALLDWLYRCQPKFECLYTGELAPDMAEVAPYLVHLEEETEFADWLISKGWGNHWGVFAQAQGNLRAMRQHFRRFLTVYDETGKPLLFRYYDPRVLRVYLPTCNAEELAAVFGPVRSYILEGETPDTALRFEIASGALKTKSKVLKES